jgi:hypothetical protein
MGLATLLAVSYDLTTKDGCVIEIPAAAERAINFGESVVKPSAELQKSGLLFAGGGDGRMLFGSSRSVMNKCSLFPHSQN